MTKYLCRMILKKTHFRKHFFLISNWSRTFQYCISHNEGGTVKEYRTRRIKYGTCFSRNVFKITRLHGNWVAWHQRLFEWVDQQWKGKQEIFHQKHSLSFIGQLLPTVFKSQAWGILHTLLEMLSFRMHHIQSFYRVQFLSHLHSLASVPHTNQTQIHLCVESTALRLITGMGSAEVQPQLSRYFTDSKIPGSVVSTESEELNRALILTVAHSMHITGSGVEDQSNAWCKELLSSIMQHTPHSWASHTLQCFPPILNTFFTQNPIPKENKQVLKKCVEDEYRNWTTMTNENDVITHFTTPGTPPLFLCVLIKMILETDSINPVAYKWVNWTSNIDFGKRWIISHICAFTL